MEVGDVNLAAGWAGIVLGAVSGSALGLFFARADWLGGYGSWPRRMLRLAHVSLVGLGLLNIALGLTVRVAGFQAGARAAGALLLVGLVTMPATCALSAWRPAFRHAFPVPVLAVMIAAGLVVKGLLQGGAP